MQLLDPVQIIDLLLNARVEVHRRTSDPREGQSAHSEQRGTGCHNDHTGRPFRLGDVEYPPEGQGRPHRGSSWRTRDAAQN